jgi:hypothetical protein
VIEVVIGMSLVYLVVSAAASAINEFVEGALKRRSKYLAVALHRATNSEFASDLYGTMWIKSLMTPLGRLRKHSAPSADEDSVKLPSYIPSDIFAAAVREMLENAADWSTEMLDGLDDSQIAEALELVPVRIRRVLPSNLTSVSELRVSLRGVAADTALRSEAQQAIVNALPPHVFDDLDGDARNLQRWYEATMDRMSGWYKRRTRWWLILWGACLAVLLNIDTLAITRILWTDEAVRDAAVAAATDYLDDESACTPDTDSGEDPFKCVDDALDQLKDVRTLGIPVGWNTWPWQFNDEISTTVLRPVVNDDGAAMVDGDGNVKSETITVVSNVSDDPRMPADGGQWILKLLGLLVTAVAISFGAPVWFDVLNKFVNFRASGAKPVPGGTIAVNTGSTSPADPS